MCVLHHEPFLRPARMSIRINLLFVFIFLLSLTSTVLFAQNLEDDYSNMKHYKLDKNAIAKTELTVVDSLYMYKGKVFSGKAFEEYSNHHLKSVETFKLGYVHGPFMLWYPDGAPQLYTNYYKGAPNGRFMGWYSDGKVIYNLVLNQGKLGGDYLFDTEDTRQAEESDDTEKEGTDNSE